MRAPERLEQISRKVISGLILPVVFVKFWRPVIILHNTALVKLIVKII